MFSMELATKNSN